MHGVNVFEVQGLAYLLITISGYLNVPDTLAYRYVIIVTLSLDFLASDIDISVYTTFYNLALFHLR